MFDGLRYRTSHDRINAHAEDVGRAAARSRQRLKRRRTIYTKASLAQELKCFKEAVRYITDNDLEKEQQDMF